jgi:hypothetical protein
MNTDVEHCIRVSEAEILHVRVAGSVEARRGASSDGYAYRAQLERLRKSAAHQPPST